MKKLLLTAAAILTTLNMYGQGTTYQGSVAFNTTGVADSMRVKDTSGANLAAGYVAALYWGAAGETDDRNLTQIGGSTAFLTGAAAGTFFGSGRTITYSSPAANGAILSFQVRAWNGTTTDQSTYQSRLDSGTGFVGKGPIVQLKTQDLTNPLETKPNIWQAVGYTGFTVSPVPEPSVIALGVLGAGALLMLRRRK